MKLDSVTEVLSEYEYEDWVTPSLGRAGLLPYRKWDLEAYSQNPKDDSCDGVDCGLEC